MEEEIGKILKAEEEARQTVEAAKKKAGSLISEAQEKVNKIKEETLRAATREKDEYLHLLESGALEKKRQAIAEASRKAEEILREKSVDLDKLADKMFERVMKIKR